MSEPTLYNVLFAWKCSSTHHKLALDALRHLQCPGAERWRDLFLSKIEPYLAGSKAPDNDFKDFKNHVLHVSEGFWGGAVAAAQKWYETARAAFAEKRWSDAVYAAGVLSHYYSDPWQPFHTGQSEAEGVVHRAAEWSIACSYQELQQILEQDLGGYPEVTIPPDDDWLGAMIRDAAATAHEYYRPSIDHYNFAVGKKDPPAGFDQEAKDFLAVLLGSAVVGFARILDRIIVETGAVPPSTNISLLGVMAQLTVPIFWVTRKLKDAKERAVVEAMYQEFQRTGKVIDTLPEDDWNLRRMHAEEVLKKPLAVLDQEPIGPLGSAYGTGAAARTKTKVKPKSQSQPKPKPEATEKPAAPATSAPREPKFYLKPDDPVEAAPSIGPKTAERLEVVGIRTVRDLLAASPENVAKKLNLKHIDAAQLRSWQAQAQLVCDVPGLRGHDAQILASCQVNDATTLQQCAVDDLLTRVLAFIKTPSGERILRDGKPPDRAEVEQWISAANSTIRSAA